MLTLNVNFFTLRVIFTLRVATYLPRYFCFCFQLLNYFVWLWITIEGSLPETRIWSIMLLISGFQWYIHQVKVSFHNSNVETSLSLTCHVSRLEISNISRYFYFAYYKLDTEFDSFFLPNSGRFSYNICNRCSMQTEDAYSSRCLVLFPFGTCIFCELTWNYATRYYKRRAYKTSKEKKISS